MGHSLMDTKPWVVIILALPEHQLSCRIMPTTLEHKRLLLALNAPVTGQKLLCGWFSAKIRFFIMAT